MEHCGDITARNFILQGLGRDEDGWGVGWSSLGGRYSVDKGVEVELLFGGGRWKNMGCSVIRWVYRGVGDQG